MALSQISGGVSVLVSNGVGFTVTVMVTREGLTEYVMVAVPGKRPDTIPDVPTVAIAVLLLLQVPPLVASVNAVVLYWHTTGLPLIGRRAHE